MLSKLLFAGLFFWCALNVSAQCVDDEKEAKKLQEQAAKIEWSSIKTLEFAEREIKKAPKCFYFYALRGRELTKFNVSRSDALANFKKAEELAPLTTSQYWRSMVEFYTGENGAFLKMISEIGSSARKEQKNQLCIDAHTLALTYKTTKDFLLERGDCYYNNKQYESASSDYLQGLDILSKSDAGATARGLNVVLSYPNILYREKFYLMSCRVRPQIKELIGAALDCQEALKIDPNLTEAKELLASIKAAKVQDDLALERKRVADKLAAENAETNLKNKMAKENPLLFQAYSEAIEKKNYQYISRILANKEFECVECFTQTIKSSGRTNSTQFFDFAFLVRFGGLPNDPNGPFGAVLKTKLTYKAEIKADADEEYLEELEEKEATPTLPSETWWQRAVKIRVKGDTLTFETVTPKGVYSTLLEGISANPAIIKGLKLDCDCVNPDAIYNTVSERTGSFLDTNEATIKSIDYQGRITLEMVDSRGQRQIFVSK